MTAGAPANLCATLGGRRALGQTFQRLAEALSSNTLATATNPAPDPESAPPPTPLSKEARASFERWDTDGDERLDRAELDQAIMDPRVTGAAAAAAVTLRRSLEDLEDLSDDDWFPESGVSLADLEAHERSMSASERPEASARAEAVFAGSWFQIEQGPSKLFPDDRVKWKEMRQGTIGDCSWHAAAVSLAVEDPAALRSMIQERPDGGYAVTFPGREPIEVAPLTDGEIALYGTAGPNGRWLPVLEKAFGQLRGDTEVPADAAKSTPLSESIEILTGAPASNHILSETTRATLAEKLTEAFDHGRIVIAAILGPSAIDEDGLVSNHAYAIIGHDAEEGTVTLRNPWGRQELEDAKGRPADGKDDGIFTMTYDELRSHFGAVTFEEKQAES
jgi:hypothetical protein